MMGVSSSGVAPPSSRTNRVATLANFELAVRHMLEAFGAAASLAASVAASHLGWTQYQSGGVASASPWQQRRSAFASLTAPPVILARAEADGVCGFLSSFPPRFIFSSRENDPVFISAHPLTLGCIRPARPTWTLVFAELALTRFIFFFFFKKSKNESVCNPPNPTAV